MVVEPALSPNGCQPAERATSDATATASPHAHLEPIYIHQLPISHHFDWTFALLREAFVSSPNPGFPQKCARATSAHVCSRVGRQRRSPFYPVVPTVFQHHDQNLRSPRRGIGCGDCQPMGRAARGECGVRGRSCGTIKPVGFGSAVGHQHADFDHGTRGRCVAIRGHPPERTQHEAGRGREGASRVELVAVWRANAKVLRELPLRALDFCPRRASEHHRT